ncbi:hypothetical protein PoB_002940300 [Plakobranchus ocellatus]|uniref:Uncharacterized protein n=1 Tax=Plakobranchus ocellatus TaxID=259542 RepID=A0AAV4A844_9GAST|nr:hypothetical protein PoB_002940300 [Plakobranchus ocellatus]
MSNSGSRPQQFNLDGMRGFELAKDQIIADIKVIPLETVPQVLSTEYSVELVKEEKEDEDDEKDEGEEEEDDDEDEEEEEEEEEKEKKRRKGKKIKKGKVYLLDSYQATLLF